MSQKMEKKVSRWKKNFWHSKGDQIFQTFRYGLWLLISATTFSFMTLSIAALYIELHYGESIYGCGDIWPTALRLTVNLADSPFDQPIPVLQTKGCHLSDRSEICQFDWQIFQTFHYCMWLLISATTFSIMTLSIAALYIKLHYGECHLWLRWRLTDST